MGLNMMGNGWRIYSMDKEKNFGQTIQSMKDSIGMERSKDLDGINGLMVLLIKECGVITN